MLRPLAVHLADRGARVARATGSTVAILLAASCGSSVGNVEPAIAPHIVQASGTRALLIAVSPVSDRVVWASGSLGTWLRTTDGGTTWSTGRVAGADSLQFRDVHGVDSLTAFLLSIGNGAQSRIYGTLDGGTRWTLLHTNPDSAGFYDCMDFWDARRGLFVGDAVDGRIVILTTANGGDRWERVSSRALPAAQEGEGSFAASGTCVETHRGGHAWVVMNGAGRARLLRTSDYGRTWATETLPITTRPASGVQSVSFADARNGAVFGGGSDVKPGDVLVATTADGGDTWTPRASPPFRVGSWGGAYVPLTRGAALVAAGPNGAAWARVDGAELSWTRIDSLNYWSVGFASHAAGWAVGTQGRITRLALPPASVP